MLTIGEFSKLSRVSTRMLRYYDNMGLISPEHLGEDNGYRYYDAAQLQTLNKIESLKEYGFTLSEIKELLPLSEDMLAKRLHHRRLDAYNELNEMRKTIRRMEDDLIKMEESDLLKEKYHVITMEIPAQKVFSIRKKISISETHALFQELKAEMKKRGLSRTGATQQLYHGEEFSYENMDVEAQVQVSGDGPDVKNIPSQFCAAVTHQGPYEDLRYAYEALTTWLSAHPEYKVCGPAIERYIKDEDSVSSPEELETGVLFPIKRV